MQVTPMSAPLGARVEGIDVKQLDDQAFDQLKALFRQYHVLAFPNQKLSIQEHLAFGERWGTLLRHPYGGMPDHPDMLELKNRGKRRDVNQHWHSDMTYNLTPPKLTMLYAHETPSIGGDTAFSNQVLAFDELSAGLKSTLAHLRAVHSAADLARLYNADTSEAAKATHPVVRTHDESGKKALYVCRAFTEKITGWSRQESAGLLGTLFEHSVRPEFQGRHAWQSGDLLMWDNRSVMHYAVHDHGDEPRVIHRLQIEGEAPA